MELNEDHKEIIRDLIGNLEARSIGFPSQKAERVLFEITCRSNLRKAFEELKEECKCKNENENEKGEE